MTLRIFADENIPGLQEYLGEAVSITRFSGRQLSPEDLCDADALLVRSVTPVNEKLLAQTRLGFVGSATSGIDHIDQGYLAAAGIHFSHAPGSNANSVVEYVLAAIAVAGDRLERLLQGGRVGIVGYGHVGKCLAARLQALNIAYSIYDPWLEQSAIAEYADLEEVLGCDVVSLHCELTTAQPWPSHHLLNHTTVGQIAAGALLINASRGSVVQQSALLQRLATGDFCAVLDVWEGEPDIDVALLQRVRLGTAHIAGYSADGKALATRMLCDALAAHFNLTDIPARNFLPALPGLSVAEGLHGAAMVRALLQSRYDIQQDDASLRRCAASTQGTSLGSQFDQLRRDYPVRRELAGSTVLTAGLSSADQQLVAALGCRQAREEASH